MKAYQNLELKVIYQRIASKIETSVASHCKQFESPIRCQSQVNYFQRLCRALRTTYVYMYVSFNRIKHIIVIILRTLHLNIAFLRASLCLPVST